jgi:hypothetical protein
MVIPGLLKILRSNERAGSLLLNREFVRIIPQTKIFRRDLLAVCIFPSCEIPTLLGIQYDKVSPRNYHEYPPRIRALELERPGGFDFNFGFFRRPFPSKPKSMCYQSLKSGQIKQGEILMQWTI